MEPSWTGKSHATAAVPASSGILVDKRRCPAMRAEEKLQPQPCQLGSQGTWASVCSPLQITLRQQIKAARLSVAKGQAAAVHNVCAVLSFRTGSEGYFAFPFIQK